MPPEARTLERRMYPTEFREVPGSNGRQRWARAVTYGTVDSYGSMWSPGVFNAGLASRMPTILYGHDWWSLDHVLGRGVDFRDVLSADDNGPPGCDVLIEFADPDAVPSARLAMTLTAQPNPVLRDVSVGFDREEWLRRDDLSPEQLSMGAEELIQRALMDELSVVVRGAVPGAQLRSRSFVIDGKVVVPEDEPRADGGPLPEGAVIDPGESGPELFTGAANGVTIPAGSYTIATNTNSPIVMQGGHAFIAPAKRSLGITREDLLAVVKMRAAGQITEDEANTALDLLDGRQLSADPGEQVGTLAQAVDASIDSAILCAQGVDVTTWPSECQQMLALIFAADATVDELLDVLGVPDPDEPDEELATQVGAPPMTTASKAAPDERAIDAALALARRR